MDNIHAFIFAGGLGTRLRPLTFKIPKPMIPINGVPIIHRLLSHIKSQGINNIHLSLGYMSDIIANYVKDLSDFSDINFNYIVESHPLGTAGSLKLIENILPADSKIIALNGDLITQISFEALHKQHCASESEVTVCTKLHETTLKYGVIESSGNLITGVSEKPIYINRINCGIYMINKSILKLIKYSDYTDMPELINNVIKCKSRVGFYDFDQVWHPVDNYDDLRDAEKFI